MYIRDEIGRLANGEPAFDRHPSHIHKGVRPALPYALQQIKPPKIPRGGASEHQVFFPAPIGQCYCVPTTEDDTIIYAQRVGRPQLSRFVLNREPEPSDLLSVVLGRPQHRDGRVIVTAFWGPLIGCEQKIGRWYRPYDFWRRHALIWGFCPIVPGTETDVEPLRW